MPPSDFERTLDRLEADLKRLEAEYNMFFAGRAPRPPWETRSRVEAAIKKFDRAPSGNYGERYRFSSLQARFAALTDLWDRGLRAREEGRAGPLGGAKNRDVRDRIVRVASFTDPSKEPDKLRELYDAIVEARREVGSSPVSFDRFSELVTGQVEKFRKKDGDEVAFRVGVQDGKVTLTARALRKTED